MSRRGGGWDSKKGGSASNKKTDASKASDDKKKVIKKDDKAKATEPSKQEGELTPEQQNAEAEQARKDDIKLDETRFKLYILNHKYQFDVQILIDCNRNNHHNYFK